MIPSILIVIFILVAVLKMQRICQVYAFIFSFFLFHEFIKQTLINFTDSVGIFPIWRELAVLLLLYKIISLQTRKISASIIIACVLISLVCLYQFIIGYEVDNVASLSILRLYSVNMILLLCAIKYNINKDDFWYIIKYFSVVLFIICISGIVERFFLHTQIHTYMGHIDSYDSKGNINYTTASFYIMGYSRMCGILNGPNQFGICLGLWIPLIVVGYLKNIIPNKKFAILLICLAIFCLALSFSRAGYFIMLLPLALYFLVNNKKIIKAFIYFIFSITFVIVIANYFVPEVLDILYDSITGKEASVATRSDFIEYGLEKVLREPMGHGLGMGRKDGTTFTESSFLIIAYEIGIYGLIVLFFLYYVLLKNAHLGNHYPFHTLIVGICIASIIAGLISVNFDEAPFMFYFWTLIGFLNNRSFLSIEPPKYNKALLHNN